MAIQSSLLKPIYVAFALGENSDGKMGYDNPTQLYAQIDDVKSVVARETVGIVPEYDRLLLVPYGEKAQFIDEQSLLWVAVEPNANKSNSDYKIERVGDVVNGSFILYCNSLTPRTKPLYYENKGTIYQVKVDFDSNSLVAIVPMNKYLPINNSTKVWYTKPSNSESTKNLLRMTSKDKLGKSYKFKFVKVGE